MEKMEKDFATHTLNNLRLLVECDIFILDTGDK